MNIEELKRLAEVAPSGPWTARKYIAGVGCGVDSPLGDVCHHTTRAVAEYIAAANPAAMLELIAEIEYRTGKAREHFDAFLGCNETLKEVTGQRDTYLAELEAVREDNHRMMLEIDGLRRKRDELLAALNNSLTCDTPHVYKQGE